MSDGTQTAEAVVIEGQGSDPDAVVVTLPTEPEPETTGEAVAIIEAEGEVAIELAEIHAETERQRIAQESEGNELWQTEMRDLREQIGALGEAVSATATVVESLLPPSIPPISAEPEAVAVIVDPATISLETTPETPLSEPTDNPSENPDESPVPVVAEIGGRKHRVRMI
jgi:hypothetical protein